MNELPRSHPLAEKVLSVARERGIDIKSYKGLHDILLAMGHVEMDARTILILSDLVEQIQRYDSMLDSDKMITDQDDATDEGGVDLTV